MILTHCRELAERSTRGEFENASRLAGLLIRMHLLMCRHCRRFKAQLELISQAARENADSLLDPSRLMDFKKKLIQRLER